MAPRLLPAAECVRLIQGPIPDISVKYLADLVAERNVETHEACEQLVATLVDEQTYPKQSDSPNRAKRKRTGTDDEEAAIAKFRKSSLERGYPTQA